MPPAGRSHDAALAKAGEDNGVTRSTEVAAKLGSSGDEGVTGIFRNATNALITKEEKGLVFDDRTAERGSELILNEHCLWQMGAIGEEGICIKGGIA